MDVISRCRVVIPYEKKDANELTLKAGEVVEVIRKGKSIWYGKTANGKGFFPCSVVEDITENGSLTTNGKVENTAKPNKIIIPEKTQASTPELLSPTTPTEFVEIPNTEVLDDAHRSRLKSAARPPSQVFIKNFILATDSINVDCDSENEEPPKPKTEEPPKPLPRLRNNNLVMELKQKSSFKVAPQPPPREPVTPGEDGPAWVRNLLSAPKKKMSVPAPPEEVRENSSSAPLWMQEIKKRREHKLSLKGDELDNANKVSHDIKSVIRGVQVAHGVVKEEQVTTEVKGKTEFYSSETRSQTQEEEKKGVDMPAKKELNDMFSFSSPPSRISMMEEVSTKKVSSSASFSFSSRSVMAEKKNNDDSLKKDANETSSLSPSRRTVVEEKQVIDTPTRTETISSRKIITEDKKGTDILVKRETTITPSSQSSSPLKIKDVSIETKTELSTSAKPKAEPISEAKNGDGKEPAKENTKAETGVRNGGDIDIANTLLKSVESFEETHKARTTEMLVNVKKLEEMIHRRFQQDQKIIEEIKAKVSDLIKSKD